MGVTCKQGGPVGQAQVGALSAAAAWLLARTSARECLQQAARPPAPPARTRGPGRQCQLASPAASPCPQAPSRSWSRAPPARSLQRKSGGASSLAVQHSTDHVLLPRTCHCGRPKQAWVQPCRARRGKAAIGSPGQRCAACMPAPVPRPTCEVRLQVVLPAAATHEEQLELVVRCALRRRQQRRARLQWGEGASPPLKPGVPPGGAAANNRATSQRGQQGARQRLKRNGT